MPKNNVGRQDTVHPMYGFANRYLRVGDFPGSYHKKVSAHAAVSTNIKSAALTVGARGIQALVKFSDAVTSCDIQVYRVDAGPTDTLVWTWTGINQTKTNGLFVGHGEGIDLQGKQIKIGIANIAGGGSVTIDVAETH